MQTLVLKDNYLWGVGGIQLRTFLGVCPVHPHVSTLYAIARFLGLERKRRARQHNTRGNGFWYSIESIISTTNSTPLDASLFQIVDDMNVSASHLMSINSVFHRVHNDPNNGIRCQVKLIPIDWWHQFVTGGHLQQTCPNQARRDTINTARSDTSSCIEATHRQEWYTASLR